jgi:hypothetical protein
VTFFWDIADKISTDVPWGVTANLIAKRDILDGVEFDCTFPKTGGGEDIDYCRKKRQYSLDHGGEGFAAAPHVIVTHPWWYGGARTYWRFYMWSVGDGALIKKYPAHAYRDWALNSSELFAMAATLATLGLSSLNLYGSWRLMLLSAELGISIVISNIAHDCYRHLWRDSDRVASISSSLTGYKWGLAVVESALIRMASEGGRFLGLVQRGELAHIGWRFDWFAGRWGDTPRYEERKNGLQRFALTAAFVCLLDLLGGRLVPRPQAVESF